MCFVVYLKVLNIFFTKKDSKFSTVKMDRKMFKDFLNDNFGMTDGIIMDRLFKHFNKVPTDDLDLEEWVLGFSIFLKGLDSFCLIDRIYG